MTQYGIQAMGMLPAHNHKTLLMGGTLDHADLTNVLTDQHHGLPNLGDLTVDVGFKAYLSADYTIVGLEKVPFDTEVYDIGGDFNVGTYEFTVPSDGYYFVRCFLTNDGTDWLAGEKFYNMIYIDDAQTVITKIILHSDNATVTAIVAQIFHLVTNQHIEIRSQKVAAGARKIDNLGGICRTYFEVYKIGE